MNSPKLILADEPTGNLDEGSGDSVINLLLALCVEEEAALVLVTHNPTHAARCARRLFLREGGFHAA
jgi:predicted ABC-type transport system involved in lysophospholipase L1 biosynthesis ATPase subunit